MKWTFTSAIKSAARSLASSVATSLISTTKTSHIPKAILFCRNRFSTPAGSLTTNRAIAESVDSETLIATTSQLFAFSSFTMSSMAPTLFAKKTENCFTSGPSRFEVVLGKSSGMNSVDRPLRGRCKRDAALPPKLSSSSESSIHLSISLSILRWQTNSGITLPPVRR